MQLLIEPVNYTHAINCIEQNVDIILVGNEQFSTRIVHSFSIEEIKKILENKKNTQVWIKVNTFFFEPEIIELEKYLTLLSTLPIDKVVFQDYAICEINHNNKLGLELHYNPDTLITSYGQFYFFRNINVNSCFLARELLINEILEIAKQKETTKIEVQGLGYGMIMHSRWKIITNFESFYNTNIRDDDLKVLIRENLRKIPNIIFEDIHGTHMLTGYIISAFKVLEKLNNSIDYLSLSFLCMKNVDINSITTLFLEAFNDIKNNSYDAVLYIEKLQKLLPDKLISAGFLGGPKDILHMQKEEHE